MKPPNFTKQEISHLSPVEIFLFTFTFTFITFRYSVLYGVTIHISNRIVRNRNGILLPKLFCLTVRKKCPRDREKILKFEAERPRICKNFEITLIICSNSERSEQFLVTECFFNFLLEVSHI